MAAYLVRSAIRIPSSETAASWATPATERGLSRAVTEALPTGGWERLTSVFQAPPTESLLQQAQPKMPSAPELSLATDAALTACRDSLKSLFGVSTTSVGRRLAARVLAVPYVKQAAVVASVGIVVASAVHLVRRRQRRRGRGSDDDDAVRSFTRGKLIGRGGQGAVHEALHPKYGLIAVKEISQGCEDDILHECVMLQNCGAHPFIVATYGIEKGHILMELCQRSLEKDIHLVQKGLRPAFNEGELRLVARQLLLALQHLHSQNTLHRDVKPHNVLVDAQGHLKLCDFGLSRHCDTVPEVQAGTVAYLSPEAALGRFTAGSDLWALGCTLSHLGTTVVPWHHMADRDWRARYVLMHYIARLATGPRAPDDELHPLIPACLSVEGVAFMSQLFALEASARGTCDELLSHPWITNGAAEAITAANFDA